MIMCNRYNIKGSTAELVKYFDATLPSSFAVPSDDVLPGHMAPGLLLNRDGERELVPMQFGLAKSGSEVSFDRKWPNNNARIEKYGKWPWKTPFERHRCVVPVSEFREPCYWGDTAGSEVYFKPIDLKYLGVASLYGKWKSRDGEELFTMSFLMRPASRYVMDHGHHRQPFFIQESGFNAWMDPELREAKDSLAILRKFVFEGPFEYTEARKMAPIWKTRQKARLLDRDEQLSEVDKTGPLGF